MEWNDRPLAELIDHIVAAYHRPLAAELGRVKAAAAGARAREGVATLVQLLEDHVDKEEQVIFPWIRSGRGRNAAAPIAILVREHEDARSLVASLRGLEPGLDAALDDLERRLYPHFHLEDDVLYPRALAS